MPVVLDGHYIHSIQIRAIDRYDNSVRLGIQGIPDELSDAGQGERWACQPVELVSIDLDKEALSHECVLSGRCNDIRTLRYCRRLHVSIGALRAGGSGGIGSNFVLVGSGFAVGQCEAPAAIRHVRDIGILLGPTLPANFVAEWKVVERRAD
jgi:hypothetical protein